MARNIIMLLMVVYPAFAWALPLRDVAHDAEASFFYGDFFHSYRDYAYIENESESAFAKYGVAGYLRSLFIIGDGHAVEAECGRLTALHHPSIANEAAYLCGDHFVEQKDNAPAKKYLKLIRPSSNFYWPGQILLATAYIVSNEPQAAVETLKTSDLPRYKKWDLADQFYLTLARAFAAENKFDDAIHNYQLIDGKSTFYIETLEESAWIFFKIKRFESAQVLLDAIIGNFESAQRLGNMDIPLFTYYRARYLKAYQALAEKRTEGAAAEFAALRNEYGKTLRRLKPELKTEDLLLAIHEKNLKWTDIHNFPEILKKQLDFVSQWLGADAANKMKNEIYFQMAISRELARAAKYGGIYKTTAPGYVDTLQALQEKTWKDFEGNYGEALQRVAKDMETIKIKAELGRLEIVWLKRADGARSLDEVIDNYKLEARSIDEYFGNDSD